MAGSLADFRIGDHRVEPSRGRIVSIAGEVHVEPRAMDVLVALASRPGDTVSRDDLIAAVWKHPHVSDEALSRCISLLRQALGDDGSKPRLIETVPKRGYRLVAPVDKAANVNGTPVRVQSGVLAPDWNKTNLTLQLTRIIGRETELAEVRELLTERRLVTLTGSAGVGKTRLAMEMGKHLLAEHADGVWLVELAPLSDSTLIPPTVATLLGIELGQSATPAKELARRIGQRELLLILDNCEHVIDAVATLAETVLGTAPNVRILATSQSLINIGGEQAYRVPSLAVPDDGRDTIEDVLGAAAAQLFLERAKAADSRFRIDDGDAHCVAAICRRLDGIPLAIEMAAARAPLLGVEQLAALLDERFRLLTSGRRTALPRQQTLRATLDWSFNLLSERERMALARLGVFAGSFPLQAASAVLAADQIDKAEVVDLLAQLVARSLVAPEAHGTGMRYRLLQTTRAYALEQLDASGESDATHARHIDYYLKLAEAQSPNGIGAGGEVFGALHLERENFLAAHAWCDRAPGGADAGLRLAFALKDYWVHRGGLEPGYRVTVDALRRAGAQRRDRARCRALFTAALLATCLGRHDEVLVYREECLSIARELKDENLIIFALMSLAEHFCLERQWQPARRAMEEAADRARNHPVGNALFATVMPLGDLDRIEGDLQAAERRYTEGLAISRTSNDPRNLIVALIDLAIVAVALGSPERAPAMLLEALANCQRVDSKPLGSVALVIASGLAASLEQWQHAAVLFGAATRQFEEIRYRCEPADEAFIAPLMARVRDVLGETDFAAAEAVGRAYPYDAAVSLMRSWLQALATR